MQDRQTESSEGNQKYELLFQRDQEMSTYLDSVESVKDKLEADRSTCQATIVALLEHLSQQYAREIPEDDELLGNMQDMQGDLVFKEKQLESSAHTKERLEKELTKRQMELEKVNSLDDKITIELRTLNDKLVMMERDMETFEQLDSVKETSEHAKQHLQRLKQKYIRRRDAIVQQVQTCAQELSEKQHQLADMETTKSLDSLEQKLRHYEQNIYHLKQCKYT